MHYAIIKTNYEAFQFLVNKCMKFLDIFRCDEAFRSPRAIALINSPFYKVLVRLEKEVLVSHRLLQAKLNNAFAQNVQNRRHQRNQNRLNGGL